MNGLQEPALRVVGHRPHRHACEVLVVEGGVAQQIEVLLLPRVQQAPVVARLLHLVKQRFLHNLKRRGVVLARVFKTGDWREVW